MNTKKSIKKRSDISKLYGMFLLLFISIVGFVMSEGNPVCYVGMAYAIGKILLISRKHIPRIIHSKSFTRGFIISYTLLWIIIASLIYCGFTGNVILGVILFFMSVYFIGYIGINYQKEATILQKIIEEKIKEKLHEYIQK